MKHTMRHTLAILITVAGFGVTCLGGQLAPEVEPVEHERVPVLFGQINRGEEIEFDLLCRALVGPQMTLRAYAATLLGESGDRRAIPYLIDALADESVHVGATYVDPGDATTRHRANKALKRLTGRDFGFVWSDPRDKRTEAIRRWTQWFEGFNVGRQSVGDVGREPALGQLAPDTPELRDPEDLLWLLDRDPRLLSVDYQRALEVLGASLVPDAGAAEDVAVRFLLSRGALRAEEAPRVAGLLRLGRDVASFARGGDLVWVVRVSRPSLGVTQELWVASTTGEVRAMLPVD